jgi:hypothetical protein
MHYENGPLWSRVDQYLKNHGTYAPDKFFNPAIKLNKKLPGHFRRLNIEVKIPPNISRGGEIRPPLVRFADNPPPAEIP